MSLTPTPKPSVLFVCVHNAGRSQMAAGFLRELGGGDIEVRSAGSAPAESINPVAVDAMRELGIDITRNSPALLDADTVRTSDVVITMGCGDTCPIFPGKRYEDWDLDDPAGQNLESVRRIRDDIRGRVEALISDLVPDTEAQPGTSTTETPQPTEEALHE
ncbi:arsenate reductase ArsC [Brevibacterium epidermidis]|uniref:arsenate reductase ArsC n=1 Tax=Brevibacterium epidermidis TaxID=1698 RepID=UPI000BF9B6AA|nr:arsenate reductase ArsC [Brevibacterium epidermidis]